MQTEAYPNKLFTYNMDWPFGKHYLKQIRPYLLWFSISHTGKHHVKPSLSWRQAAINLCLTSGTAEYDYTVMILNVLLWGITWRLILKYLNYHAFIYYSIYKMSVNSVFQLPTLSCSNVHKYSLKPKIIHFVVDFLLQLEEEIMFLSICWFHLLAGLAKLWDEYQPNLENEKWGKDAPIKNLVRIQIKG